MRLGCLFDHMQAPFQSAVQPRWEGEGMEPVPHLPDSRLTHSSLKIHAALSCLTSNMPGLKLTAHWCHLIMLSPLSLFPNEELRWDAGEHLTSSVHLTVQQFTQLKKFQDLKDWRLDSCYKKEPLVICFFVLISDTLLISELWSPLYALWKGDVYVTFYLDQEKLQIHAGRIVIRCNPIAQTSRHIVLKNSCLLSRERSAKSCRWLLSRRRKKYEELRQQRCLRRFWRDCCAEKCKKGATNLQ